MQGRAITSDQIEKMLEGLRLGMTRRAAAGHAGFAKSALYRMLESDDDGTLGTEVEKAEASAEAVYSALVAKAAGDPKNWTAAAWWLERRHPSEYGKRERVEMTGKDGGPIDHRSIATLPDHERQALADAIRDHLRSEAEPARGPAATGGD